jgi:hypothetical protein
MSITPQLLKRNAVVYLKRNKRDIAKLNKRNF